MIDRLIEDWYTYSKVNYFLGFIKQEEKGNKNMKKNGFTLAEVLITLAIIGVVASLTLPALMTNVQEQQAVTGLKKGANTLVEAATFNAAANGFDFNDIGNTFGTKNAIYTNGNVTQSVWGILGANANVDMGRSTDTEIIFRDGTSVRDDSSTTCTGQAEEGIANAKTLVYDTNGPKSPNALSTCTNNNCATRQSRQIKDRFTVCVGGSSIWGYDAPARWALTGQAD